MKVNSLEGTSHLIAAKGQINKGDEQIKHHCRNNLSLASSVSLRQVGVQKAPWWYNTLTAGLLACIIIAGVAWAPLRGIALVEVQVDDEPWQVAELSEEVADTTWRQFHIPWEVTEGLHRVRSRATDGDGVLQPENFRGARPNGAEGWHRVEVVGV